MAGGELGTAEPMSQRRERLGGRVHGEFLRDSEQCSLAEALRGVWRCVLVVGPFLHLSSDSQVWPGALEPLRPAQRPVRSAPLNSSASAVCIRSGACRVPLCAGDTCAPVSQDCAHDPCSQVQVPPG